MASPQGYSPYPQGGYNSVPPNQEYQTLSVVAPYGVYPGQMFNITGPDGNPVQVQMPMGSAPGQTILVNVPVTRYAQPTYSQPPGPTYAPQQTPPQNMQSPPPQSYAPVQQQQHDLRPSSVPQHQLLSVQEKEARQEAETADAALAKAIEKSEEFHLHAQFVIQEKVPLDVVEALALFDLFDSDESGGVTQEELIRECTTDANPKVREIIYKYDNTPLGLLLYPKKIREVFSKIDTNRDGSLSKSEWKLFLVALVERDLVYVVEKGWASNSAYWGRGEPQPDPEIAFFNKEWLADWWYYECNNHALLGIFLADKANTLQPLERLNIEFCVQSWILFWGVIIHASDPSSEADRYLLLFCLVTLPSLALRTLLLYMFKCPCLVRRHNQGCLRSTCFPMLECLGHGVGLVTFLFSVILLVAGIIGAVQAGPTYGMDFLFSWLLAYFTAIVINFMLVFNPFKFARSLAESFCLFRLMGLAKWQRQRAMVFAELVSHAEDPRDGKPSGGGEKVSEKDIEGAVEMEDVSMD